MFAWFTRGKLAVLILVLLVALVASLVFGMSEDDDGDSSTPAPSAKAARDDDAPAAGDGSISVTYKKAPKEDADAAELVTDAEIIEKTATAVSDAVALPEDVEIVMGGDDDGPYYDPNDGTIQFPWWFVTETRDLLADSGYKGADLDAGVLDATKFILLHEIGHALVDRLELPVLGKEEDAADSFAAFVSVEVEEDGELVIGATDLFAAFDDAAAGEDYEEAEFWDSHSLDAQRFYSISCLVYGADPKKYDTVVDGLDIDDERLGECEEEWQQASGSWYDLLDPYLRED